MGRLFIRGSDLFFKNFDTESVFHSSVLEIIGAILNVI